MILIGKYAHYWPTQDHNLLVKLDDHGGVDISDGFIYIALTSTSVRYRPLKDGVARSSTLILQVNIKKAWVRNTKTNKQSFNIRNALHRVWVQRNLFDLIRPILLYLGFSRVADFDTALVEIRGRPSVRFRGELPRRLNTGIQLRPEQLGEVTNGLLSYADEIEGDPPQVSSWWACLADYKTAGLLDAGLYTVLENRTGLARKDIQSVLRGVADAIQATATTVCQIGLKDATMEIPFLGEVAFQLESDNPVFWDGVYNDKCDTLPLSITWQLPKSMASSVVSTTPLPMTKKS